MRSHPDDWKSLIKPNFRDVKNVYRLTDVPLPPSSSEDDAGEREGLSPSTELDRLHALLRDKELRVSHLQATLDAVAGPSTTKEELQTSLPHYSTPLGRGPYLTGAGRSGTDTSHIEANTSNHRSNKPLEERAENRNSGRIERAIGHTPTVTERGVGNGVPKDVRHVGVNRDPPVRIEKTQQVGVVRSPHCPHHNIRQVLVHPVRDIRKRDVLVETSYLPKQQLTLETGDFWEDTYRTNSPGLFSKVCHGVSNLIFGSSPPPRRSRSVAEAPQHRHRRHRRHHRTLSNERRSFPVPSSGQSPISPIASHSQVLRWPYGIRPAASSWRQPVMSYSPNVVLPVNAHPQVIPAYIPRPPSVPMYPLFSPPTLQPIFPSALPPTSFQLQPHPSPQAFPYPSPQSVPCTVSPPQSSKTLTVKPAKEPHPVVPEPSVTSQPPPPIPPPRTSSSPGQSPIRLSPHVVQPPAWVPLSESQVVDKAKDSQPQQFRPASPTKQKQRLVIPEQRAPVSLATRAAPDKTLAAFHHTATTSTSCNDHNRLFPESDWVPPLVSTKQLGGTTSIVSSTFDKKMLSRRALCIGVSYKNRKCELGAAVSDAYEMRNILTRDPFRFKTKLLVDTTETGANAHGVLTPTKENILDAIEWLVRGCTPGDVLLFYYAGCTAHLIDVDGAGTGEVALAPADYGFNYSKHPDVTEPLLVYAEEIHAVLREHLVAGVQFIAILDTTAPSTIIPLSSTLIQPSKPGGEWDYTFRTDKPAAKLCRAQRPLWLKWSQAHIRWRTIDTFAGSCLYRRSKFRGFYEDPIGVGSLSEGASIGFQYSLYSIQATTDDQDACELQLDHRQRGLLTYCMIEALTSVNLPRATVLDVFKAACDKLQYLRAQGMKDFEAIQQDFVLSFSHGSPPAATLFLSGRPSEDLSTRSFVSSPPYAPIASRLVKAPNAISKTGHQMLRITLGKVLSIKTDDLITPGRYFIGAGFQVISATVHAQVDPFVPPPIESRSNTVWSIKDKDDPHYDECDFRDDRVVLEQNTVQPYITLSLWRVNAARDVLVGTVTVDTGDTELSRRQTWLLHTTSGAPCAALQFDLSTNGPLPGRMSSSRRRCRSSHHRTSGAPTVPESPEDAAFYSLSPSARCA